MNSVTQTTLRDAIHYCEVGIVCFITFAIIGIIGYEFISSRPLATSEWVVSTISSNLVYMPAFIAVSIVLAWATYQRLVIPLKLGRIPRHAHGWTLFFGIMAVFYGFGFGTVAFFFADAKIRKIQLAI